MLSVARHNNKSIWGPTTGPGAPAHSLDQLFARLLEIVAATTVLLFFAPILLISSAAIKLDSGGPVFARVTRRGTSNRPIQVLRFRVVAATLPGENNQRLSRVGLALTQSGIAELSQFFNVLRGEISFIEAVKSLL
jgi:lipopolysaccharide/colanic/teichoic acid biosynthesis glycosyltransferase